MTMTFGSLFAGIGGMDLGLERAGMVCKWQVEIDDYATKVLEKHWPDVPKYRNICEFPPAEGVEPVDLICGGFPCQDISYAGKGAGLDGERSGLFYELIRVVREVGPRYVLLENVSALLTRGLCDVLGTLASLGYDAEWHCIQAADVGAPHIRDRVFILGYSSESTCKRNTRGVFGEETESSCKGEFDGDMSLRPEHASESKPSGLVPDSQRQRRETLEDVTEEPVRELIKFNGTSGEVAELADADIQGLQGRNCQELQECTRKWLIGSCGTLQEYRVTEGSEQWEFEPDVGRVVARISNRLDGGRLNEQKGSEGTIKILRALQQADGKKKIQWPSGGFGGIQEAEVLLSILCEHEGPATPLGNISLSCEKTPEITVRGVWFCGESACSSCRRAAEEQRGRKHTDIVCLLSQLLACDCCSAWLDPTGTPSKSSRVDRLRGLGNAVVPQVAEYIGRCIVEACLETR